MLSICAFLLLSILILRVNNSFLSTDTLVQETKFDVLATSLATSYIEEATRKRFDEVSIIPINDSTLFSYPLGLEAGELHSDCNDFDDYNGLDTLITDLPSATFRVQCKVAYINPNNPDVNVNYKTWNKKLTVSVSSPFSNDTIKVCSIFSYFNF